VYGRQIDGKRLTFEASGALKDSALVLRDRETDSWWSLMASRAIGGQLDGAALVELPGATKTTWARWRRSHPDTLVLSIGGREHEPRDPYAGYFSDAKTFRNARAKDRRREPKEPVFAFWHAGTAFAVAHRDIGGGARFDLADGTSLFFFREPGASVRASSAAFRIVSPQAASTPPAKLAERVAAGDESGLEPLRGFDTFWYVWIAAQPQSRVLAAAGGND
jgi:hypothetical protein